MTTLYQQEKPEQCREFCEYVFNKLDLDYKKYVDSHEKFMRPEELPFLRGNSKKIRNVLVRCSENTVLKI